MIEILKVFGGLSGILGIIGIVTYFLFSIGINDAIRLEKSSATARDLKSFSMVMFGIYIFFILCITILIYAFSYGMLWRSEYMIGENILTVIYLIVYLFPVYDKLNEKRRLLYGKNTYTANSTKGKCVLAMIVIVFVSACTLIINLIIVGFVGNVKSLINAYSDKEIIKFLLVVIQIGPNYIAMVILNGYINGINILDHLPRYIISSGVFENNRSVAYIMAENKEEIMLKCDESYPIIIKKENVDGYMIIPNDVQVEENEDKIIFKNKYGEKIDYKGYLIKNTDINALNTHNIR